MLADDVYLDLTGAPNNLLRNKTCSARHGLTLAPGAPDPVCMVDSVCMGVSGYTCADPSRVAGTSLLGHWATANNE